MDSPKMGKVFVLPRKNLEFIAQDIGDELMEFFSVEQRLKGLSVEQRLEGLSFEERLEGLSPEQQLRIICENLTAEELKALAQDKFLEEIYARKSAEERIARITALSEENRLFILDESILQKLSDGLVPSEQQKLLTWIEANE